MTTDLNAEKATLLLRRLLESMCTKPEALQISYREMPDRVDWKVQADINDQGVLVGRSASHIRAVKYLMAELGTRAGMQFVLRLEEGSGRRELAKTAQLRVTDFNANEALWLLKDWLDVLLDEAPIISVDKSTSEASGLQVILFKIEAKRIQDHEQVNHGDPLAEMNVGAALALLFKAIGHRSGVVFKVEAKQ